MTRSHLEAVVEAFVLPRNGDLSKVESLLREDVVWQGLREDYVCHDRREVLDILRHFGHVPDEHIELVQQGDKVALGMGGTGFDRVADIPVEGQLFQVFTFEGDKVVHMQDYLTREEALAAAGAVESAMWRG
jgi:ketosteroid isomerase-like protein